jgi:hypothetical protein
MQNIVPSAEAIRVLQILGRHKIAASWVGGKVEFRSAAKPTAHLVALLDSHESAIVELMRPNGDGQSFLDLARDRHRPLLEATERQRPPDVADGPWRTAIDGLWAFLAGGYGDEAERLGWPRNEIYAVPALWARVDLCGAALMIGDSAVVAITSAEIRIKTVGGASQAFYRKPEPDFGLIYSERVKLLRRDVDEAEARARAYEYAVGAYRAHRACDLEEAKRAMRAAVIAKGKTP